ncbi:inositol hexakisphosphate-domain-containing protein [Hysterangium stoloniferum]|nr:inositol hexakisphosphate-domain-containing protein [Hysterangium stoloniferum]
MPDIPQNQLHLLHPSDTTRALSVPPTTRDNVKYPHKHRSVVKTRSGSVLSRGMILKSDHYPSGRALQLDISLQGAPNFRAPRQDELSVFGVAQPRLQGLKAILSVLGCRPDAEVSSQCIWFSTREEPIGQPYVLRDASEPRKSLALSNRAENLADIEKRLKSDILSEASRYGGLILTHLETETHGDGAIVPTWTAIEPDAVLTLSELGKSLQDQGWNIQTQPIEDNYLDAYLRILLDVSADPCSTSLLFSCGMGAVRTTFAMCASSIVRRRQIILKGRSDSYEAALPIFDNVAGKSTNGSPLPRTGPSSLDASRTSTPPGVQAVVAMGQFSANQEFSKSLLRLTSILQQCLQKDLSTSAIEWLLSHPSLAENLRKATNGNYGIILSLLGCLDNGLAAKRLVDKVIDSCDHVINLREDILINRIKYSLTTLEDKSRETYLDKAAQALEKYFFLIAFASYVEEQTNFVESFGEWMKARIEIWNQVTFLRKTRGSRLNIFAPVSDLSSLAKSESEGSAFEVGPKNEIAISGGQVLGDEWSTHVIENRAGIVLRANTLLKSDQWINESDPTGDDIRGAMNFRNVSGTKIYALGQPSLDAIDAVIDRVKIDHPGADKIVWITLREEPIVYVNGMPFCLRRDKFTLRNMKDYSGVSAERLETMEERLKSDVLSELHSFEGSLLLHTETAEGSVVPVWEQVQPGNVSVVREIMTRRRYAKNVELCYRRIPITSEHAPDFSDFAELLDVVVQAGKDTPFVLNCQLGRGRSTMASIILCMIQRWREAGSFIQTPTTPRRNPVALLTPYYPEEPKAPSPPKCHSYKAINHILRVIRYGRETKNAVDSAIDQCAQFFNLRDSIEDAASQAEDAPDDQHRRHHIERGIHNLQRYFQLVVFQAYLNANPPDTLRNLETFESFVKARPVFQTFQQEIHSDGIHALKPLEHVELAQGIALSDEVKQVVANRAGTVLSASTILKSDFFSHLQKLSLPERLNGAPNFRRSPLTLMLNVDSPVAGDDHKQVCGTGIPTIQGLKLALSRVNAGIDGDNMVAWTSLREEPVLYVAGRPHVLRFLTRPLENVESTGISIAVVEQVEITLKNDVLRELREKNGKLLLHDEMETEPGTFEIVPQWEQVTKDDILTPREVFDMVAKEGYKVDYARIPVTDEQAPLPSALAQLLERVRTSMDYAGDLIFNCQMGRGRTTTGMVAACLISTILTQELPQSILEQNDIDLVDVDDGPSSEEVYSQGEYKVILQLVGVLSFGKLAKRITDTAIDRMQDVQNLRVAIYDYKLKVDASIPETPKYIKLQNIALNYLYRYATLIVFANYLVELKQQDQKVNLDSQAFPNWLAEHREISQLLSRRSLD